MCSADTHSRARGPLAARAARRHSARLIGAGVCCGSAGAVRVGSTGAIFPMYLAAYSGSETTGVR